VALIVLFSEVVAIFWFVINIISVLCHSRSCNWYFTNYMWRVWRRESSAWCSAGL